MVDSDLESLGERPDERPRGGDPAIGRDEMNLAEFPLVLLTDRVPADLRSGRSLRYETNGGGRVTVSGGEAYGLPTAGDADVLVGLIQLTRRWNNFADPRVPFTRYELLKVLRWSDEGKSYRRLEESLNRWIGVTLYYDNAWWDNLAKKLVTAKLHVIETIVIDEHPRGPRSRPGSYFVWNATFIQSCQADNLKQIDLDLYFGLRSAISKRIYRFLDKRFYRSPDWTFDLRQFAFDHVGVSRSYAANVGKIKEKLQPALDELEAAGFLEPMRREDRYSKQGRDWSIRLIKKRAPLPSPPRDAARRAAPESTPSPLAARLAAMGVTSRVAHELIAEFDPERIERQIDILEWMREYRVGQVKEPGAWVVSAIRDDYAPPAGYLSKADREEVLQNQEAALLRASRDREEAAETRRRERADDLAIEAYWAALTPEARQELQRRAIEAAPLDPSLVNSRLKRAYAKSARDDYIRKLLSSAVAGSDPNG